MIAADPAGPVEDAPAAALRRALIDCTAGFDRMAALVAITELAVQAERPDIARLFDAIASLHRGPASTDEHRTLDVPAAIDDLTTLRSLADAAATGDVPTGSAERIAFGAIPALCDALAAALADPDGDPAALLDTAHAAILGHPPYRLADHVADPLLDLAGRVAFNALRHFFRMRHDLAFAPLGSAALFHAAARLDGAGLGPHLGHAAACSGPALLALVRQAEADLLWTVRMAPWLDRSARFELVDALGDAGALPALRALFRSERRRTVLRLHPPIFWSIRDAAIDLGDPTFAADAQRYVAERVVDNPVEWIVLAEVEATVGRTDPALEALARALAIDPDNHNARDKTAAIEAGRIADLAVAGGFGSDTERRLTRFMRRRARQGGPQPDAGPASPIDPSIPIG